MKILIAHYTLFLILLSCDSSQKNDLVKQTDSPNNFSIYTGWQEYNLQGKPREVIFKYERNYEINRENWSYYENANEFWSHSLFNGRLVFDSLGFRTFTSLRHKDSIGIETNDFNNRNVNKYIYDIEDYKIKIGLRQLGVPKFPIEHPYGIQVNYLSIYTPTNDTTQVKFDYVVDKKKIIREDIYVHEDSLTDLLRQGNNTFEKRIFSYDEKDRIIKMQFLPDEYLKDDGFMYKMQNRMVNDIALPAGETNLYTYTYDENDRITQTVLTINDFKVFQEDYAYDNQSDLPFKVNRFTLSTVKRYPTKNMELYYDDWGNLTQRIDIDDNGKPVRWRYYDYEYDSHNNWVRLDMFMEGTKEKSEEPTLTVFRDIKYF
ncbi:hypothetical protein G5B37_03695 [Rasiella rasia]|uniref:Uncharacterized protein n=1 Tax=Rasiella rasia TaxID=2744027 RepID=A0A6G6GJE5_9FLAO|nr:hypothetical protein [Rasiella rasia]QIE58695.1 hypothetical protein G5B37_03695 [Rasiella rasia]